MFERFTDRARRAVVLAQEEARLLGTPWIGAEHLVLGLVIEGEAVAAKAFANLGVNIEATRERAREVIGERADAPSGHIPFTPHVKKCLERALREALELGHNYIGTEHVLLGLTREAPGPFLTVEGDERPLVDVTNDEIRNEVFSILSAYTKRQEETAPPVEATSYASATEAIEVCVSILSAMESDAERVAVVAFLDARYQR